MSKAEELESLMAVLSIKEQRIKELESQVGSIREQVSLLSAAVAPTTKKLHNPSETDYPVNIRVQVNPDCFSKYKGRYGTIRGKTKEHYLVDFGFDKKEFIRDPEIRHIRQKNCIKVDQHC
jgi:ribosomal protein L21E